MRCNINGKIYEKETGIKDNDSIRGSFCSLSKKIFNLDFEYWYQNGFWSDLYIPHVLMDQNAVVSNVSVNILDMRLDDCIKRYIQIGTVMTDPAYRGQGLSRLLIEDVLSVWKDSCDAIFLFANDSVLDFYPKFGFEKAAEYQFYKHLDKRNCSIRKLDMSMQEDRNLLINTYKYSNPYSEFAMESNEGLLMFYCLQFMKDDIYYFEDYKTVVIAEQNPEHLLCYDVFSAEHYDLDYIISGLTDGKNKKVLLGFTPKDKSGWNALQLRKEDTTLFLLGGKENPFKGRQMMFPLLSHA